MAKYGSPSVVITYNGANISQYVTEINDIDVEAMMEETHTFGDSWVEATPVGLRKLADIKLTGFYDDTATTGPDAVFVGDVAATPATAAKSLVITYGGSKTSTFNVFVQKYSRKLDRGKLHKFTATLQPTGSVSEA